jgi:hypothetical protein
MILKRDVRGVITSIPPKRLALRGKMSTAAIAMTTPRAATNEHQPAAAVALPVLVGGFASDTPATAVARLLVSPIASTTRALITTMASGDTSLSSSRYDIVESRDLISEISSLPLPA